MKGTEIKKLMWLYADEAMIRKGRVGRRVLIATDYPSVYEAVRYFGNKFNRFGQEVTATHWMPLPLPPMPEGE
ncbi:TPA: DUF551 domain-containing protein [Proteus mirabilis]|uniref:hypothetical protein n=1 Tax=Proteus mirabilis TaxID=584 RepID=UPI001A324B04|nr:DUF551 domain-containing protein [Proteus mirabilis]HEJ1046373.1 DUF551 domain-containing protein [Proteus mirabilis]HEK1033263.1 DUF551 domain-containing protein [Proteus mirabilis]